ncbi:tetratricopeptide repeat protein [Chryseosolibacter indicus]|uniref:Tetratricopeptide repeat protein n=1 Tax=Chryseosolibacter indicus TaxID=2782351 RepID=A0ABS5VTZ4_9BACT|nr:tetratricopeptide repeat protein [Chryseosolibacter indicus]
MILFCKKIKRAAGLVLLLTLLATNTFAQKKKKEDSAVQGLRLREAEFYFTEGEKFFILEDYAKALIYYQKALEANPTNGTIHYKIAEVLSKSQKQEDLVKASISIENAIQLDKTNKFFYLSAATIYNSLARFDKAAQVYENMISEVKGTEEYLYELAAVYQYANRMDDALRTYERAEKALGINEISSIQKMRLFIESGKVNEGLKEGEKLITAFPDDEQYLMAFTEVLSKKGMREQAIQYLEKYLSRNENAPGASMLLASFYRETNQEQKARPLLIKLFDNTSADLSSKLIVLGTYNAELNNNRSKGISDADKEAFALSLLEKLKASDGENTNVHIIGGDLYLSTGRNREAQKEYLIAAESGEVNFEVWENLLYLEIRLEQYDNVLKHAEQALELFPNQAMIHYFNGFANLRKRNYEESIYSFEQAKRLSTSNAALTSEVNGMLGDAYNAVKNYEKSDKAFEDALLYNPNNDAILNNYSYYLALRKENLEKAEKMAATLIKNHPDNPTYLDTYAWVLYVRQKYKEARKAIEKAISTGKATATHFEHYGDILYQLGEVDGAVKQWEKARGLNAKSETLNKKIANRKIYE